VASSVGVASALRTVAPVVLSTCAVVGVEIQIIPLNPFLTQAVLFGLQLLEPGCSTHLLDVRVPESIILDEGGFVETVNLLLLECRTARHFVPAVRYIKLIQKFPFSQNTLF
jgi:hypothetical protein